jgi:hypothetical protein
LKKQIENIKNEIQNQLKNQYNLNITISERKIKTFNSILLSDIYPVFFKVYNITISQNMDLKKFKIHMKSDDFRGSQNLSGNIFFITLMLDEELSPEENKVCKKIIDNFEVLFYNIEKNLNTILNEFKEIETLIFPVFRGTSIINKLVELFNTNGYTLRYGIDYTIYPKIENEKKLELFGKNEKIGIIYNSNNHEELITLVLNEENVKVLKNFETLTMDEEISKFIYSELEKIIDIKSWVE